jgi:AcrR family transcriptional regulator
MPLQIDGKPYIKPAPRGPGQRANLTMKAIVEAALSTLQENGLEQFSARLVSKKLKVTSGAIYAHLDDGLADLKVRMARATLMKGLRPYRRTDTPKAYLQQLLLGLLKSINGKRPLAQLVCVELSADYLVCAEFIECLFQVPLIGGRGVGRYPARRLDLAMAVIIGMLMVEGETSHHGGSKAVAYSLRKRIEGYPAQLFPRIRANSSELMVQILRRLRPNEDSLSQAAARYAQAILSIL